MDKNEIYNAVRFSHDNTAISGSAEDLAAAFRMMKKEKYDIDCRISISHEGMKGRNVRKCDVTDGKAMFRVFSRFVSKYSDKILKPLYDEHGNAVIGTDGRMMLVSRIPEGFGRSDAVESGFEDQNIVRWDWCCGDLTHDDYTLSNYVHMAEIKKGGELHWLVQTVGALTKAYNHEDDGDYRSLYFHIGEKCYNASFVTELIDGLFRLGCDTVKVCEQMDMGGGVAMTKPLHIFGIGTKFDAKGVVMPIRIGYGSMADMSGISFPIANSKAVAA